ncbi:MAG TPA: hypothetical protein ENK84_02240 [Desulfobulbus sp.]|nr:hypothetical protein [Desulfobulbus sp.]
MKRFFSLLFSLLILTGISYTLTTGFRGIDLLTLIPRQSGTVITWDHPARDYRRFVRSRLGKNISTIDRESVLTALGLPAADITTISTLVKLWHALTQKPLFQDILGKKIVLALVPGTEQEGAASHPSMEPLFLSAVGKRQTDYRMRSFLHGFQGVTTLPPVIYQGYTIYGFTIRNIGPLYVACSRGVLLAAFDPAPIRQSLDLLLAGLVGKGDTIRRNSTFLKMQRQAKGQKDFFCYIDAVSVSGKLLRQPDGLKKIIESVHGYLQHLAGHGLRRVAFYHGRKKKVHQLRLQLQFAKGSLPPFQKLLAGRRPSVDRELMRTTANLQLYFRSNWLDLPAWWRMTIENGNSRDLKRAERLDRSVHRYTGMDMERFLGLFGHRFSLLVKEFKTSSFFPIPRICLRIALTDGNVVHDLLEKFVARLPHRRETMAGHEVVSILAAGGLMQPSYVLSGRDLCIVDGRDLVNDLLAPKTFLTGDPDFKRVALGSDQPANLIFFARMQQVTHSLKEAASWLGTLVAVRDNPAGARSKILVDQLALPIFDGMAMFKTCFVIGRTRPGELDMTARLLSRDE